MEISELSEINEKKKKKISDVDSTFNSSFRDLEKIKGTWLIGGCPPSCLSCHITHNNVYVIIFHTRDITVRLATLYLYITRTIYIRDREPDSKRF